MELEIDAGNFLVIFLAFIHFCDLFCVKSFPLCINSLLYIPGWPLILEILECTGGGGGGGGIGDTGNTGKLYTFIPGTGKYWIF